MERFNFQWEHVSGVTPVKSGDGAFVNYDDAKQELGLLKAEVERLKSEVSFKKVIDWAYEDENTWATFQHILINAETFDQLFELINNNINAKKVEGV